MLYICFPKFYDQNQYFSWSKHFVYQGFHSLKIMRTKLSFKSVLVCNKCKWLKGNQQSIDQFIFFCYLDIFFVWINVSAQWLYIFILDRNGSFHSPTFYLWFNLLNTIFLNEKENHFLKDCLLVVDVFSRMLFLVGQILSSHFSSFSLFHWKVLLWMYLSYVRCNICISNYINTIHAIEDK